MVLKDCLPGEKNMPGEKNVWNKGSLSNFIKKNKSLFTPEKTAVILLGTALLSFGLYNIHRQTGITEGGVLGLILLINHWTGMKSSLLSPLLDLLCYAFAFPYLGRDFLKVSVVSTLSLAGFLSFGNSSRRCCRISRLGPWPQPWPGGSSSAAEWGS